MNQQDNNSQPSVSAKLKWTAPILECVELASTVAGSIITNQNENTGGLFTPTPS